MAIGPQHQCYPITGITCLYWLQPVPTVCHLLINRLLARPKRIWSHNLSHVSICDMSGDLLLLWSCGIRSPDSLAHASYFSGSCVGLITGLTCGTFDLELRKLNVVDRVHDSIPSLGFCCTYNTGMCVFCLNLSRSSLAWINSFSGSQEFSNAGYPFHLMRYCMLFLFHVGRVMRMDSIS